MTHSGTACKTIKVLVSAAKVFNSDSHDQKSTWKQLSEFFFLFWLMVVSGEVYPCIGKLHVTQSELSVLLIHL